MKRVTAEELKKIIEDHQHYLRRDCKHWLNKRADFSHMDLSYMDLCGADLREAKFVGSYLGGTRLSYANLQYAIFYNANLTNTDLTGANLISADFDSANLCRTVFYNANIENARFRAANLEYADLDDVIGRSTEYITGKILTESIIGYKKCIDEFYNEVIVALEIPKGAIVFSINGKKCRTNKAKVVYIQGSDRAYSTHKYMSYYPGDEFDIKDFNCMYNIECAEGIHFFTDRWDAVCYCG